MQDVILRPFSRRAEGDVGRTLLFTSFASIWRNFCSILSLYITISISTIGLWFPQPHVLLSSSSVIESPIKRCRPRIFVHINCLLYEVTIRRHLFNHCSWFTVRSSYWEFLDDWIFCPIHFQIVSSWTRTSIPSSLVWLVNIRNSAVLLRICSFFLVLPYLFISFYILLYWLWKTLLLI